MTTVVSPQLKADEASCQAVLHMCDLALKSETAANALDQQIIADQGKVIGLQVSELHTEAIWKPLAIGGISVALLTSAILILRK